MNIKCEYRKSINEILIIEKILIFFELFKHVMNIFSKLKIAIYRTLKFFHLTMDRVNEQQQEEPLAEPMIIDADEDNPERGDASQDSDDNDSGQYKAMDGPLYTFQPFRLVKRIYKQTKTRDVYPVARSGHRVIASESFLYALGGYNPRVALSTVRRGRGECLLFQELWAYNFATNRWSLMFNGRNTPEMPKELASNALVLHKDVLISHGGTGYPFGESCSNDCIYYKVGPNSTVKRIEVTGDLPAALYGPGIVIHDDYLYTIGGTTGFDYSCDVFRLNLITKVWESVYICRPEMRDDPEGRYRHEVVYDGSFIFVLGGGTSQCVFDLKTLPAFNLNTNTWEFFETLADPAQPTSQNYPSPRKCFSCVQHKNSNGDIEAFIAGGLKGDFLTYFADIWRLNVKTKQWTCIKTAQLPRPMYFHSAAHAGNGCMYVFGGIEYTEKEMCRRNDLFKMWMTIPKLSEICWDAITFYNENLHMFTVNDLLKSGIPARFIQRVPTVRQRKHSLDVQAITGGILKKSRSQSE